MEIIKAQTSAFSCNDATAYGNDDRMVITADDLAAAAEIGDKAFAQQVVGHWEGATTQALVLAALNAARAK